MHTCKKKLMYTEDILILESTTLGEMLVNVSGLASQLKI